MELAGLIARFAAHDGVHATPIPRLDLVRMSAPTGPVHAMHEQAIVFVAQGVKEVILGERVFVNGPEHFLVVSVSVPVIGRVSVATVRRPYLCMRLHLNVQVLRELLADGSWDLDRRRREASLSLGGMTPELLDAATRFVSLLGSARDSRVLAPLVEREILYRLLLSNQADRLRQIAQVDGRVSQVNKAVDLIKKNFDKPLSIDAVARKVGLSQSALHEHFRAITGTSPLQYQKRVRLQEARRLIFAGDTDVASAAYQVGYESPSQFNREYRRLFGAPPRRDQQTASSDFVGGI